MPDFIFGEVGGHNLVQILLSKVYAIDLDAGALELLVLPSAVRVIAFNLGGSHDGFQFLYALSDGIDCVVLLLEVCGELVIESHVDVVKVVLPLFLLLEIFELVKRLLDGFYGSEGVVCPPVRLAGTTLDLFFEPLDILVQRNLRLASLLHLELGLSLACFLEDNIVNDLPRCFAVRFEALAKVAFDGSRSLSHLFSDLYPLSRLHVIRIDTTCRRRRILGHVNRDGCHDLHVKAEFVTDDAG